MGITFEKEQKVLVVAEDTIILVLLWFRMDMLFHHILIGTDLNRGQKAKLLDINKAKDSFW